MRRDPQEAKEKGIVASVEIKSLNGRYLEVKSRLPRQHSFKEIEIRDIIKKAVNRGSVQLNVNVEADADVQPFVVIMNSNFGYL